MRATRLKIRVKLSERRAFAFGFFVLVFLCWVSGCSTILPQARMQRKIRLYDKELSAVYDQTKVKKSLTLDVLPRIEQLEGGLLSQSENVAASQGKSKDGYKTWFTLIAFHPYELSVMRKYFFVVDERVENRRKRGLRFDCELFLGGQELEKLHAAKGGRQAALLIGVLGHLQKDITELAGGAAQDSRMLDVRVLLIKQVFDTFLLDLERLPHLATRLGDPGGVEFDHLNFGKGKIYLGAEGNIAVVKVRLGALLPTFDEMPEPPAATHTEQPANTP